jgi:hypothetical protein
MTGGETEQLKALPLGERYPWGWFSVLAAALVIIVAALVW